MDQNTEYSDLTHFTGSIAEALNRGINGGNSLTYVDDLIELWNDRVQQLDSAYDKGEYIGDVKTHQHVVNTTKQEYNAWLLLKNMLKVEQIVSSPEYNDVNSGSIARKADFAEQYSMVMIVERIIETSPEILRYQSVIDWLEQIAPVPQVPETSLVFRQSMNKVTELQQSSPGNVSYLDPDTEFRKLGKDVIHVIDKEDEQRLLSGVFQYIRVGSLSSAADLCRSFQQQWRAASLLGSVHHHTNLNEQDDLFGTSSGNNRYFIWKAQCRSIATNSSVSPIEAAVYGSISGVVNAVMPQCLTWVDACWARLKTNMTDYVDSKLINELRQQTHTQSHISDSIVDSLINTNIMSGLDDIRDDLMDLKSSSFLSMGSCDPILHQCGYLTSNTTDTHSNLDVTSLIQVLRQSFPVVTDLSTHELSKLFSSQPLLVIEKVSTSWMQALYELIITGHYHLVSHETSRNMALLDSLLQIAHRYSSQHGAIYVNTLESLYRQYTTFAVHLIVALNPQCPYNADLDDVCVNVVQRYLQVLQADIDTHPCVPVYTQLLPTEELTQVYSAFLRSLSNVEVQKQYISEAGNYVRLHDNLLVITKAVVSCAITNDDNNEHVHRSLLFTPIASKNKTILPQSTGRLGKMSTIMADSDSEEEEEESLPPLRGFSLFTPTPSKPKQMARVYTDTPAHNDQNTSENVDYQQTHSDFVAWVDSLTCLTTDVATINTNISCCALSLDDLQQIVPAVHAHKIESVSCLAIDPDQPSQITHNPQNLLEAALYSNGLLRAFIVAQSLPSARLLAAHCDDLVATVEDLFGHDMAMLVQPSEAIKQLTTLREDVQNGLLTIDGDADDEWLVHEAEGIEARGNSGREMIAWRYYLTCLVWFQAFASLVKAKPSLSLLRDEEYLLASSGEQSKAILKYQAELSQWLCQVKDSASSLFEAFKRTLLFPGGWLCDILLDISPLVGSNVQRSSLHPNRESELDIVRRQAMPQLCLMLMYVADALAHTFTPEEYTVKYSADLNSRAAYWNMNLGVSLSRALTELIVDDQFNLYSTLSSYQLKQVLQLAVGLENRVSMCPHQAL